MVWMLKGCIYACLQLSVAERVVDGIVLVAVTLIAMLGLVVGVVGGRLIVILQSGGIGSCNLISYGRDCGTKHLHI